MHHVYIYSSIVDSSFGNLFYWLGSTMITDKIQLSNLIKRELFTQKTCRYYAHLKLFTFFHYSSIIPHKIFIIFYLTSFHYQETTKIITNPYSLQQQSLCLSKYIHQ